MPFAFERFELIKNIASDINDHVETIFNITGFSILFISVLLTVISGGLRHSSMCRQLPECQ